MLCPDMRSQHDAEPAITCKWQSFLFYELPLMNVQKLTSQSSRICAFLAEYNTTADFLNNLGHVKLKENTMTTTSPPAANRHQRDKECCQMHNSASHHTHSGFTVKSDTSACLLTDPGGQWSKGCIISSILEGQSQTPCQARCTTVHNTHTQWTGLQVKQTGLPLQGSRQHCRGAKPDFPARPEHRHITVPDYCTTRQAQ